MAAIRSSGNRDTELRLADILRSQGITGWRRHQPLPGKPDFVFRRERLAVFVDGCFWHGCPKHGRTPDTNSGYWHEKLARNRARDLKVSRALSKNHRIVLRLWEHDPTRERSGTVCAVLRPHLDWAKRNCVLPLRLWFTHRLPSTPTR